MNYIRIIKNNIKPNHIFCVISNNKDREVSSKKLDGKWITNEQQRDKKFLKLVKKLKSAQHN